jgi:anti-anti-sigma regulatory factor
MFADPIPSSLADGSVALRGSTLVIAPTDEPALRDVDELARISTVARGRGTQTIVIDVSALADVGNDTLVALCAAVRRIQHCELTVTITGLDSRARELLELVKLDGVTLDIASPGARIDHPSGIGQPAGG